MAGSLANGWSLAGQCWKVLRLDKELLLFPILSTFSCLLVLASFAVPVALSGQMQQWFQGAGQGHRFTAEPLFYILLFAFYFVNYAVVAFFNAALVACAIQRFGGQNPTLGSGIAAAASRLPQILGWAAVGATVGIILHMIEQRAKIVGQIVARFLGAAWAIATYFAVPVLVVEKVGPIEAVKRSAGLMRKTWGTALVGNVSLSGVMLLLTLAALVPAGIGIALTGALNLGPAPALVGIGVSVVLIVLLSLIGATLRTIMVAALYEFAASGRVPAHFDEGVLRGAFRTKKGAP